MKIVCNGSDLELREGANVQEMFTQTSLEPKGVAVAVNDRVVPRGKWPECLLKAGDRVTIIRAAQGG